MIHSSRPFLIEPLEARIAPAAVFVNPNTATFTDVDGDLVTVKFSKPLLSAQNIGTILKTAPTGAMGGEQLNEINLQSFLSSTEATGTDITVTARPQDANGDRLPDGDGLVNVGQINAGGVFVAPGIDLGAVTIRGDLGKIVAGNNNQQGGGLKSLTAISLGRFGLTTGAPDLSSAVVGVVQKLTLASDFSATTFYAQAIGSVNVGGSLISGEISSAGNVGSIKIKGDLAGSITANNDGTRIGSIQVGGSFTAGTIWGDDIGKISITGDVRGTVANSAKILAIGNVGSIFIGGNLAGQQVNSGSIAISGALLAGRIGGDLIGGSEAFAGSISVTGGIGKLAVLGSVLGGPGAFSGFIEAENAALKTLKIGRDLQGGSAATAGGATPTNSGYVTAHGLGAVTIGGSIEAGAGNTPAGTHPNNGSIHSSLHLGTLTVQGSVSGNIEQSENRVSISARSQHAPGTIARSDLTIGRIVIGGTLQHADIVAGVFGDLQPANPDAQIGAVAVGGDWIASHLRAGIADGGDGFGNGNDAKIGNTGQPDFRDNDDATGAISRIASVIIKGSAIGTFNPNDAAVFAIEAQHLVSIKVGGAREPLQAGRSNDLFSLSDPLGATRRNGGTADFYAFEVA